ncbi:hypothetical protein NPIL_172761 [Nephila pilipes]|uniref:Uncharacterized protein n=1 Tax=Nephila pilipes TaxID=299642 RepID=A0A8X6NT40_NEPPI|nr:hypothetical protein NPIL_172761 [Nephila pilipes]
MTISNLSDWSDRNHVGVVAANLRHSSRHYKEEQYRLSERTNRFLSLSGQADQLNTKNSTPVIRKEGYYAREVDLIEDPELSTAVEKENGSRIVSTFRAVRAITRQIEAVVFTDWRDS